MPWLPLPRCKEAQIVTVVSFAVEQTTVGSRHLGQDLLHLGGRERSHRLRANVAQQISSQQHTGGRLVVRSLEDANLVILTERPIPA